MPYKDPEKMRERNHRYYEAHKDGFKAKASLWAAANQERRREISRTSRRRLYQGSTEQDRERARAWVRANPAKVYQRVMAWRLAHPDKDHAHKAARRARERAAFVEMVMRDVLYQRCEGRCGICGQSIDAGSFHVDHIRPLSRGGEHSYRNTQVAHALCNQRKGASLKCVDFTPAD